MDAPTRGYSMPFSANKRNSLRKLVLLAVLLPALFFLYDQRAVEDNLSMDARRDLMIIYIALFTPILILYLIRYAARIHFVPEGIAVTLWGLTIRRIPAEQIRFISAVHYTTKGTTYDKIAVCSYDKDELTALYKKETPKMFQNSREIWYGEWAEAFLYRRAHSLTGELNLHKRILWLEWDCERLEALLKMYPHAQWLDCTQKKIFDEQLK